MSTQITITITGDSVEELQEAMTQLGKKQPPPVHVTCTPTVIPEINAGWLTIPPGTDLKVADVTRDSVTLTSDPEAEPLHGPEPTPAPAPEKPKRTRKAKQPEPPAESTQEAAGEPEAPAPAKVDAPQETPAEEPAEAPRAVTIDTIAAAGAKLLDDDSSKMQPLRALLREFDVQAITQLRADQLGAFADRLRKLGAEV